MDSEKISRAGRGSTEIINTIFHAWGRISLPHYAAIEHRRGQHSVAADHVRPGLVGPRNRAGGGGSQVDLGIGSEGREVVCRELEIVEPNGDGIGVAVVLHGTGKGAIIGIESGLIDQGRIES